MEKINIIDMIYNQMELENKDKIEKKKEEKKENRHFPSGLCAKINGEFVGKCRRATWYYLKDTEQSNVIDPVALFKMEMGNMIHETLDATLDRALERAFGPEVVIKAENIGVEQGLKWQPEGLKFPVSGRIDKVVEFNGKITGIVAGEWKSTYGFGADYIKRDGAKIDNILQCLAYLEQPEIPVDAIWLVYVARDSGYLYGFQIEKDGDKLVSKHLNSDVVTTIDVNWSMVEESLVELENHIENNTMPDRDYEGEVNPKLNKLMKKSPWQCRYCSYRSLCYGCEE